MYEKYVDFIDYLINEEEMDVENIIESDIFKDFRVNNLITFGDAALIDMKYVGTSGSFWRSAYNYPKESDIINDNYKAVNVGLLTFSIDRIKYD